MQAQEIINQVRSRLRAPSGRQRVMWLAYFFFLAGIGAFFPYISLYYESIGLKGSQIGRLTSIPNFISLGSSIAFAFFSDRLRQHKQILAVTTIGIMIVLFIYPAALTFTALIPVVLANAILSAPSNAILDHTTLATLEDPSHYGKVRVGGTIGWAIMVLVTGYLIDQLGMGLSIIFPLHILFRGIFLLIILMMPSIQPRAGEPAGRVSWQEVYRFVRQREFLLFLIVIMIYGMGESSITNFLFLHIKRLGGSQTLMGSAQSISLVGEMGVFFLAHKIQARVRPEKMVLMAFIVLFTWLTGLSLIRTPNAIVLFQAFGGAGFALLLSGSVAYVNARAPVEMGATAQAIRGAAFYGVGAGLGAILSGRIYENAGPVALFRAMSFLVLGGFLFGVVVLLILPRRK